MSGRILLVDDDARITRTLSQVLEKHLGCEMLAVHSAAKAVEAACDFKPDLIILDVVMPDLDGGAVSADLKANGATCDIPVLFFTSVASTDEVALYNKGGRLPPMVSKTVPLAELLTVVRQSVGVCA